MNLQNREDYGESNTPTSNEWTIYSQTCNNEKKEEEEEEEEEEDDDDDDDE